MRARCRSSTRTASEATGCPPQQDAIFTGQVVMNIAANPL